jgi:ABC-2 type transport system permease protein
MILFKTMLAGLLRDRGACAMAFILPPLIFVIFAMIFSGTSGDTLRLKVAFIDQVRTPSTQRLITALRESGLVRLEETDSETASALREKVRLGQVDAGFIVQADLNNADLDNADLNQGATLSPLMIIGDAGKAMAAPIVQGHIQRVINEKLPDIMLKRTVKTVIPLLGELNPQQQAHLAAALEAAEKPDGDKASAQALVSLETISSLRATNSTIAYYAGAVSILFLMFSAIQGAVTLLEERQSGILDRLIMGKGGLWGVLAGKFLFLVMQGMVQVALIFLVAALAYGINVTSVFWLWLMTTLAASIAASGLALVMVAACTTRHQAQTLSTFAVLILSAIGGSMVPRFLMPAWLQQLGWFTPHAWVIEAYQALFWRGEGADALILSWIILCATGLISFILAYGLSWRLARR